MFTYRMILMLMLSTQTTIKDLGMPCSDCHQPDGWVPLENPLVFNHENSAFPLEGRHKMADCVQCHQGTTVEEKHEFSKGSNECFSCHFDIHQSSFGQDCETCHQTNTWDLTQQRFDHDLTLFGLSGVHRNIECNQCHYLPLSDMKSHLTYTCSACHFNVFTEAKAGGHADNEDCIICHNTRAWIPTDMSNHDRLFPIYSGAHRGEWSSCESECHINPNNYSDFSCGLNGVCHKHDKSKMDGEHQGEVSGYVYNSQACFQCHGRGSGGD